MSELMEPKHQHGDLVFLKTDPEKLPRMVTGYTCRPGFIVYLLTVGSAPESMHYDIEITTERPDTNGTGKAGFRHEGGK